MCHITRACGGDGGRVTGERAAGPVTTVQDCISTFLSEKQLDIFKRTARNRKVEASPSTFVAAQIGILSQYTNFTNPCQVAFVCKPNKIITITASLKQK